MSAAGDREAVIVGAGESRYARHPPDGMTTRGVLADAAWQALADAGVDARDVDGLAVASFSLAPDHAVDLAWRMSLRLRWLMEDTNGGASAVNMLQHAMRAIEAGDARTVLVLAGDHLPREAFRDLVDNYNSATRDHLARLPFGGPNALFAMLTQRHAAAHGLERADYGRLVVAQRAWAAGNPGAAYREPLSEANYLDAPMVAEPLCRYDCVPVVTGADAIVVTAASRSAAESATAESASAARSSSAAREIAIKAIGMRINPDDQLGDGLRTGLADLRDELWATAGLTPDDIDVTSVYDDYPAMALVQLADLGYGGDPRELTHRIATRNLVVNTSGGQLSAGQAGAAGGLHGLVEAVRQLRGQAGERQVENAQRALVAGYGMVCYRYGAAAGAAVLETKRR